MTTSTPAQDSSIPLVARTPHDLVAAMTSTLGCWPEESLVLALVLPTGMGPVLRLDLPEDPEHLDEWAQALDAVTPLLNRIGRGGGMFTAVFTARTGLPEGEEPPFVPEDGRRGPGLGEESDLPGGPTDGSAEERVPDFLCSTAALVASLEAMRFGWEQGYTPREMWVVDREHDRWGALPSVRGSDGPGMDVSTLPDTEGEDLVTAAQRPCWRVGGAGTVRSILASPLALSMGLRGRPLPTEAAGALELGTLPGPFDLAAQLGASAASSYRRRLRQAVALRERTVDQDDLLLRTGVPLAPEELATVDGCLSRLAVQVREDPDGEGRLRGSMLRGTSQEELVLCGAGLHRPTMLYLLLTSAALGAEAVSVHAASCRAWFQEESGHEPGPERRPEPTPARALLHGLHEGPVDRHRIRALRFLLSVLEQSLGEPGASAAALANAYLSWFHGSNTQAAAYLRRVEDPGLDQDVGVLLRARQRVPLPLWLARRP